MTPSQLKTWRAKYELTQKQAAERLYIGERQYQNWEAGRNKIPDLVEEVISRIGKKKMK